MPTTCPTLCAIASTSLRNLADEPETERADALEFVALATKLEVALDMSPRTQALLIEAWEICSAF